MMLPVPTPVATGYADASGCAYDRITDRLFIVDAGAGTINTVNAHTYEQTVLGTGYGALSDIVLSADGEHAYVTESPGSLLRVTLSSPNRADAFELASGFDGVDQIALDEAHSFAYVAEFTGGTLQKIALGTGDKTTVATIDYPRGVLLTTDGRFAYVSNDAGNVTRFDFDTNTSSVIVSGLDAPRHLTWADAGQSAILFPQPNPQGTVLLLDLTSSPPAATPIAGPTADAPYSVAVISPDVLLIPCAGEIDKVNLTDSVFSAAGPILLGIGFVPADDTHLPDGYADTSVDPTYFFQVKDCPFGGTLPLMINWQAAGDAGASFYKVFIQGDGGAQVEVRQAFGDYLWSVALNKFELVTTVPTEGFYPLRQLGQIWLNAWLGALVDTSGQPNNLNTISISLYSAQDPGTEIGFNTDDGRHAAVMIDNTVPTARIDKIWHDDTLIDACGIVDSGSPNFTFAITASAPRHLRAWSMDAYWGDNASKPVSADDYSNHVSASRLWTGLSGGIVPPPGPTPWDAAVDGDPSSTHCAHTFFLYVSDRVINGWGFIHGTATYHKSITLLL